jgi:hypothetical protein
MQSAPGDESIPHIEQIGRWQDDTALGGGCQGAHIVRAADGGSGPLIEEGTGLGGCLQAGLDLRQV